MRHFKLRSVAAAVTVMAVALLSGPMAVADPGDPYKVGGTNQENTTNPALINPAAKVQLSIHKYLGGPTSQDANGTQLDPAPTRPALQGVVFDVYKVEGVDLTTNAGWKAATALSKYPLTAADIAAKKVTVSGVEYALTGPTPVTTDNTGTATATMNAGVGLYVVAENLAASDTITNLTTNATEDKGTITPSNPSFVTLPMTHPTALNRWMYDVNVYPKNQVDTAVKALTDKDSVTQEGGNANDATAYGNKIDYTVTTSITPGMDGTTMARYQVFDELDPRLTYRTDPGVTVAITNATADNAKVDLVLTDDYTVATEVLTTGPNQGWNKITVTMTPAGLTKLATAKAANAAAQVVTSIPTFVNAEGVDGIIKNTASFIPNKSSWDTHNKTIPTNEVISKYGDVVIKKYDPKAAADNPADMTGAQFAIFADKNPAEGKTACTDADIAGQKAINTLTVDNVGKAKTDADYNQVKFKGLQTSNWYNGAEQTVPVSYCIVEVKAAPGYNLDATPHYVFIDYKTATAATEAAAAAPAFQTVSIANEKSNLENNLPLTGGEGIALLSASGLLLIGGGLAYYGYTVRRRRAN